MCSMIVLTNQEYFTIGFKISSTVNGSFELQLRLYVTVRSSTLKRVYFPHCAKNRGN